ncbi:MAG: hypothetical protein PHW64_01705 [Sulfuricurvum sp.]|nr:hypothetical protein [Sulfuricurvum sp.]
MNTNKLKYLWIVWIVFSSFIHASAAEAIGYKIVLASFSTFEETKEKLYALENKLDSRELSLQKKYRFEVVARPSGRVFILALEPFEKKSDAKTVLKPFKKFYPDAYINGYYGPTEGTLFLGRTAETARVDNTAADKEVVRHNPLETGAEENGIIKEAPDTATSEEGDSSSIIIVVLVIVAGVVFYALAKRNRTRPEKRDTPVAEEASPVSVISETQSAESVEEAEAMTDEISEPAVIALAQPAPIPTVSEEDPFVKLKKNLFFMTLLGELKVASDEKDELRCTDLIEEVLRYQKNFRSSDAISAMVNWNQQKDFDSLSDFIQREMV